LAVVLASAFVVLVMARRYFRGGSKSSDGFGAETPRSDNPAAFMTASMQAVIKKLKEQEKELEALHRAERERAQQTERMSEAVTRNMPAGLLLLNSAGLITSANPAAEAALGVKSLAYRRYNEVLGAGSRLTELVAGCLEHGRTFRREEVEYLTPSHELRQLGVTISPIQNNANEITGAICLLSDLTELAALQKQIHTKENLAALGELSAGIAHEFKNALATISGYAQMIRSEAQPGTDLHEHGELILRQTRSLTHVVTEFLKFARPLELADEQVSLRPMIERIVVEIAEAVGLTGRLETPAGALSYGEQRQLEIGIALATSPTLLLLDEPTAGMSPEETQRMTRLLAGLPRDVTVLIIEHDMDVVFSLSDRITVLHYGEVLAEGTPDAVRGDPRVYEVYLGTDDER